MPTTPNSLASEARTAILDAESVREGRLVRQIRDLEKQVSELKKALVQERNYVKRLERRTASLNRNDERKLEQRIRDLEKVSAKSEKAESQPSVKMKLYLSERAFRKRGTSGGSRSNRSRKRRDGEPNGKRVSEGRVMKHPRRERER